MKQNLKKIMPGVIICFAAASCSLVELGAEQKDEQNGVWNGPSISPPSTVRSITFVSAFDYVEGYDWQADSEKGEVKCSLVVFQEGLPILKVPVGREYMVSSDPDMHRIVEGHLYTDYSTDTETIFKKDGKPLFSYPKPEMICAFDVLGEDVHTVGHSRSGTGFSYRVNGKVVLEREAGYTFEHIAFDNSTAVIAFSEPIVSAEGSFERYYVMRDGNVSQIALRDDIKKVWDIVHYNGELYYLASLTGISAPVVVSQQKMTALSMPASRTLVSCRMNVLSEGICIEGVLSDGNQIQSVLWDINCQHQLFPVGMTFASLCSGEDGLHCAMNPVSTDAAGLIFRSGESIDMPSGYVCVSRSAMDFCCGILSVGLSPFEGGKPVLWVDGQLKELPVNGYISCVSSQLL